MKFEPHEARNRRLPALLLTLSDIMEADPFGFVYDRRLVRG